MAGLGEYTDPNLAKAMEGISEMVRELVNLRERNVVLTKILTEIQEHCFEGELLNRIRKALGQ